LVAGSNPAGPTKNLLKFYLIYIHLSVALPLEFYKRYWGV